MRPETSPSTRRLSEVARHLVYPDGIVKTAWPRIEARLSDMAIRYDGWQSGAVRLILGRDASDRYVCTVGGVTWSIPRQVGKTFTVGSLLVALCIEYPGLRVVWTSHHLRTTTNTFRSMQSMVRKPRVFPHLDGGERGIRTANGEQEIKFANTSIIMFGAREHGFGVGIDAIDILVCDEAQRLASSTLADMVPTTNQARHVHGALLFFIGTPPRPDNAGDEFKRRRRKALDGRMTNGIYIEMSADEDADVNDMSQLARANPSYPHRTPEESIQRMRENITDDDDWRREAMGVWDKEGADRPIDLAAFRALKVTEAPTAAPSYYSLTMSPERVAAIGLSIPNGGGFFVDITGHQDGEYLLRVHDPRSVVEWLVQRCGRKTPVAIDSRDPAASLIPVLRERNVKVNIFTASDAGKACGALVDAVTQGREQFTHSGQESVLSALGVANKKPIGKAGLWEWDMTDPTAEMAALRALTNAYFGSTFAKPRTNRVVMA